MMSEDLKDVIKVLVFMFLILGGLVMSSCSGGWSAMGYELTPSDTSNVFLNLYDQDSTTHSYRRPIVLNNDNFCYKHNLYEMVKANGR